VRQGGKGRNPSVQSHRGRAYCLISHVNACARGRGTRERVDVDALSLPRRKRKPRKLEQAAPRELTVGSRELPAAVADTRKRRGGRPRRLPVPSRSREQPPIAVHSPTGWLRRTDERATRCGACEICSSAGEHGGAR